MLLKNIEMADELKLHPHLHHRATLAQLSDAVAARAVTLTASRAKSRLEKSLASQQS